MRHSGRGWGLSAHQTLPRAALQHAHLPCTATCHVRVCVCMQVVVVNSSVTFTNPSDTYTCAEYVQRSLFSFQQVRVVLIEHAGMLSVSITQPGMVVQWHLQGWRSPACIHLCPTCCASLCCAVQIYGERNITATDAHTNLVVGPVVISVTLRDGASNATGAWLPQLHSCVLTACCPSHCVGSGWGLFLTIVPAAWTALQRCLLQWACLDPPIRMCPSLAWSGRPATHQVRGVINTCSTAC